MKNERETFVKHEPWWKFWANKFTASVFMKTNGCVLVFKVSGEDKETVMKSIKELINEYRGNNERASSKN